MTVMQRLAEVRSDSDAGSSAPSPTPIPLLFTNNLTSDSRVFQFHQIVFMLLHVTSI